MKDPQTTRLCVSVCEKDLASMQTACDRAIEWADLIELRLDCLDSNPDTIPVSLPVILTLRPSEQGGYREFTRDARLAFWKNDAPKGESIWWDLEGDLAGE